MHSDSDLLTVNGARLYVETLGTGPPLILIHGFTLDSRMWDDQFEPLAQHFQVIRYDLRGFGQSQLPTDAPYSHADDLRALIEALNLGETHLLGLSLGGRIAVDTALSYPQSVDKLLLVDSALGGYRWSKPWNELAAQIWRQGRQGNTNASKQLWMDHPIFAPAMRNLHSRRQLEHLIADYSGWHWAHRDPHLDLDPPANEQLEAIDQPTLVVVGAKDLPDFQAIATTLQQKIPNSEYISVGDAGHMVNMEKPEQFNSIVLNFLSD